MDGASMDEEYSSTASSRLPQLEGAKLCATFRLDYFNHQPIEFLFPLCFCVGAGILEGGQKVPKMRDKRK
jgi:hypothetical protein